MTVTEESEETEERYIEKSFHTNLKFPTFHLNNKFFEFVRVERTRLCTGKKVKIFRVYENGNILKEFDTKKEMKEWFYRLHGFHQHTEN